MAFPILLGLKQQSVNNIYRKEILSQMAFPILLGLKPFI